MKTLILAAVLATSAFAYGSWVRLNKTGSRQIDYSWAECYYSDWGGGWQISIIVSGSEYSCPYSIQYNPSTGMWK